MKFWLLTPTLNQVLRLVILKTIWRRRRKKNRINNNSSSSSKPQHKLKQAATSGGLPTWRLPQGRNTNIEPFVGPAKVVKESEAPHINKDSSPLSVLMSFTEIFICCLNRPTCTNQQHLNRQAGSSPQLPDMMSSVALALQMGH